MIIAFTNQKGGVGKTTSALNIGVYLASMGKKVLLVDVDPQANLTSGIGFERTNQGNGAYELLTQKIPAAKSFFSTKIENLYIIPSSIDLAGAEVELVSAMNRERILFTALNEIKNSFDFVLIDCPPSLGLLTLNALTSADGVIIPVQCEYFALEGLGQLMNTIKLVKKNLNPTLSIKGVLLTMFDSRTNLSKEIVNEVQEFFKDKVFKTVVPRNVRLSEAPSHGDPISTYDPKSPGALAYKSLAKEILKK
ncbi:ParA family protein [Candidatus Dojkabacteria bacterium]|nr:ParA family protein [Candidatus Dojkabacteria bacterium]